MRQNYKKTLAAMALGVLVAALQQQQMRLHTISPICSLWLTSW